MNTWLPVHGNCWCDWQTFRRPQQRDYAASQAHKRKSYIEHKVGEFRIPHRETIYWLSVYLKERDK